MNNLSNLLDLVSALQSLSQYYSCRLGEYNASLTCKIIFCMKFTNRMLMIACPHIHIWTLLPQHLHMQPRAVTNSHACPLAHEQKNRKMTQFFTNFIYPCICHDGSNK